MDFKKIKIIKKDIPIKEELCYFTGGNLFQLNNESYELYMMPFIDFEYKGEKYYKSIVDFSNFIYIKDFNDFKFNSIELKICIIKEYILDKMKYNSRCVIYDIHSKKEYCLEYNEEIDFNSFINSFYFYKIYNSTQYNNLTSDEFIKVHYEIIELITTGYINKGTFFITE